MVLQSADFKSSCQKVFLDMEDYNHSFQTLEPDAFAQTGSKELMGHLKEKDKKIPTSIKSMKGHHGRTLQRLSRHMNGTFRSRK